MTSGDDQGHSNSGIQDGQPANVPAGPGVPQKGLGKRS